MDIYGQDEGYEERVMLIYDGLHYDALAIAADYGAPSDADITIFDPRDSDAAAILEAADKLVAEVHYLPRMCCGLPIFVPIQFDG